MSSSFIEPPPDYSSTLPQDAPFGYDFASGDIVPQTADSFLNLSPDLEGLLHLGYLTDSFALFGHNFSIRTLRVGEKLAIAQLVREWEETFAFGEAAQTATVAACVTEVDSRPLSAPLGPHEDKNPLSWIQRNFVVAQQWYDPVIESIWNKYEALLIRQTRAFLELQEKSTASRLPSLP